MSKTRRYFTAEQKAQIVWRHLSGNEPVSKLAEQLDVQPSQIHPWVKQVLEQAARAFESDHRANARTKEPKSARSSTWKVSSSRRTKSSRN